MKKKIREKLNESKDHRYCIVDDSKLKPCPLCGNQIKFISGDGYVRDLIVCKMCRLSMDNWPCHRSATFDRWNDRI